MKREVSPLIVIGIVAVIVLVVGFVAYKSLFSNPGASPNSDAARKQYEEVHAKSAIHQNMSGSAIQSQIQGSRGAYGHTGGSQAPATGGN